MIIYDLICEHSHRFEGWFKTATDFTVQEGDGMLSCPVCASRNVTKLPTASRISVRRDEPKAPDRIHADVSPTLIEKIQDYVDSHYDNVGSDFPEEARKIHYGETTARNIRGTASLDEVKALNEEGIPALPLPGMPVDKTRLN
jgi:hypothetical protein